MSITFWELPESGKTSKNGQRVELLFALTGTADRLQALAHIVANTETELDTIPRDDITAQIVQGHTDFWRVTVIYRVGGGVGGSIGPIEVGSERVSFSTKGSTIRIFQAPEHIADYGVDLDVGEEPINHHGAINVTPERIEGVEIPNTAFSMQIRVVIPAVDMTQAYEQALFAATNKTNADVWRGFEAGELRLDEVQADQRDAESWELLFVFVASQNIDDGTIGSITGIVKGGHEYIWTEHKKIVDESANPPVTRSKLIAAHVERVFDSINYAQTLGLDP